MARSGIHIVRTDDHVKMPAAPDYAVRAWSGQKWNGITIEHHVLPAGEMPEHFVQSHRLTVNIGNPIDFEWKRKGQWAKKRYNSGDLMMLSHGATHHPRWHDEFNFIAIAVQPDYMNMLTGVPDILLTEQRGIRDHLLNQYANALMMELKQERFPGKLYGESLVVALAVHLACAYNVRKNIVSPQGKLSSGQLNHVLGYMHANIHTNIGLADLARLVHLSPFHVTRLFKQTLGMPPHRYLLEIKLARAKDLLRHSNLSIGEVAYDLGFSDHGHFSNAFRKSTGLSPRQFKNLR